MRDPDYIVVGAGSAGSVVAARLSEDASRNVLLLEAGPDYESEEATPPDLLDGGRLAGMAHDWNYSAVPSAGRKIPYRRGRVVGGTSAINAAAAVWPRPADFGRWAALGNTEWAWPAVEPWLRQVEADQDAPDLTVHGNVGNVPIRRYGASELIPLQRAFGAACQAGLGLPAIADHNDVRVPGGVGPWPMNLRADGTRVSSALAYLVPARHRPNFKVHGGAQVGRLIIDDGIARGVELTSGEILHAAAGIVLCAGALGTPAILIRSGIGGTTQIVSLGIAPVLDRPGVGARLYEHPSVPIRLVPLPGECDPHRDPRFQMVTRLVTSEDGSIVLVPVSFLDISSNPALMAEAGGATVVATINAALMNPEGFGRVTLASRDPAAAPIVDLQLDTNERDLRRLAEAVRSAWRMIQNPAMSQAFERVAGLDDMIIQSDSRLRDYILANVGTFNHPCGTAPMGSDHDRFAVTDQRGRVRGVAQLWIADASIMPFGVSTPPNLTIMAIGERIAAWIRTD